jgi:hypothetical protein
VGRVAVNCCCQSHGLEQPMSTLFTVRQLVQAAQLDELRARSFPQSLLPSRS